MNGKEKILKTCLNLHWLRPDNALWIFEFHRVFGKIIKEGTKKGVSLDLGCGDGTTTFIISGGKFSKEFDVYQAIQASVKNMVSNPKILNSGSIKDQHGDFYNVYKESYGKQLRKNIIKKPSCSFTFGTDWKPALLKKATDLNIYKNKIVMDANKIPWKSFKSQSVNFIFSTMLYWLRNQKTVFNELNRICKNNGIIAFSAPKPEILKVTAFNFLKQFNYTLVNRLDRGRFKNWKRHAKSYTTWKHIILKSGFKIIKYNEFQPILQIAFGETIIRAYLKAFENLWRSVRSKQAKKYYLKLKQT